MGFAFLVLLSKLSNSYMFDGVDPTSGLCGSSSGSWDTHSPQCAAVAFGTTLQLIDTREMEKTYEKLFAHRDSIRFSFRVVFL
jgi:hypothetical protein